MKINLLMVGKTDSNAVSAMMEDYVRRMRNVLPVSITVLPDLRNARSLTQEQQKLREGELILSAIKSGDRAVLLDERGKGMRSVEFAQYIGKLMQTCPGVLHFVIGGPYGFSAPVYARFPERLSLSLMTFSHQMVRLFLTEQIYRATCILKGLPYHHE